MQGRGDSPGQFPAASSRASARTLGSSPTYFDLGQQTLLFYVLHGRGRKSGAEVAMQGAQLFRWHDGLGVYGKTYAHREDALGDLGLSEDALEPIAP